TRYFRYKTPADLQVAARALGVEIRLEDPAPLLSRVFVANRAVGNRMAIQPMEGCDANLDGSPGELTFRRYRRFGSGGAKLIWGEACAVVPEGRANPRQLLINESNASSIERMLDQCRKSHTSRFATDDLLVGLQLTHSGRYCFQRPLLAQHDPLLDPRTVV